MAENDDVDVRLLPLVSPHFVMFYDRFASSNTYIISPRPKGMAIVSSLYVYDPSA